MRVIALENFERMWRVNCAGWLGPFMLPRGGGIYYLLSKRHGRRVILPNPSIRVKLIKYSSIVNLK